MATVAIKNYASGMDLRPDSGDLYVATSRLTSYTQYFPGSVTVIDTTQYAVVDTIARAAVAGHRDCEPGRFACLGDPL